MTRVLEADIIAPRIANEVAVNGDLAVSRAFLADGMRTSEANQMRSIGSGTVDDTSDASTPLSTAASNAVANKADKGTTYAKNDLDTQMSLRLDLNNTEQKSQYAARTSLDNKQKSFILGTTTVAQSIL